ncbi:MULTISPECIES: sigma-70 family RNA polymerase sigma factor [unclassified Methylosinus]|uniref:sigma-70 family RNA polymerase sigma factor n=2 Tax=unclassified Methylosinus TaxID=2624500 RepID=UPI00047E957F|nr:MULTISPECIES: sigma-70 family RNA polymerase sigma factor [unclassified Methylosinus]
MGARDAEEEWAVLMRAAIAGDSGAYQRLLLSLTPTLRGVARRDCARLGLDVGEAEDIVQETLLAIHLKRDTWDMDRPISPWIMTIARNKLIDARRRRGAKSPLPIDDAFDLAAPEAADDGVDRQDVDRLLGGLGERQRDLVRFLSIDGHSVREAAERYRMSEGAVRVALHRAIKALAALYRRGEK